jgi:gamma-glutamyl phosphate reductase
MNVSRRESENMVKTIAQALIEEGEELGRAKWEEIGEIRAKQNDLIRILYRRFEVPQEDVAKSVRSIDQIEELDELIDRAITANTFEDVGIHKK